MGWPFLGEPPTPWPLLLLSLLLLVLTGPSLSFGSHRLTPDTACLARTGLSVMQGVAGQFPVVIAPSRQEAKARGERGPGWLRGGVSLTCAVAAVGPTPCLLCLVLRQPSQGSCLLLKGRSGGQGLAVLGMCLGLQPLSLSFPPAHPRRCSPFLSPWKTGWMKGEIKAQKDGSPA